MSRTSKALDATQLTLDNHTQILKRLEQNQVQILTNQAQIIAKLVSGNCTAEPVQPIIDVKPEPVVQDKQQRTRVEPAISPVTAGELANKILGYEHYKKVFTKKHTSALHELELAGYATGDGHNYHLTESGKKFNGVVIHQPNYRIYFTRRAGVNFLVERAKKGQ